MSVLTALRRWRDGRDYTPRHEAADPFWGDTTLHDIAWDEIRDELGDDYATEAALCAPGCQGEEHRTAPMGTLTPLPVKPGGYGIWQSHPYAQTISLPPWEAPEDLPGPDGARRQAASEPAMAVMPTAEADEPLYPLEMTRVAVVRAGEPRRRRRPWSGLLGRPDPQSLPRAELTGAATSGRDRAPNPGEPILTGEIVDASACICGALGEPGRYHTSACPQHGGDRTPAPVVINVSITVNVHPSPQLKADLARIEAEALAFIARIDAAITRERDALHAWSGQLELTGSAA